MNNNYFIIFDFLSKIFFSVFFYLFFKSLYGFKSQEITTKNKIIFLGISLLSTIITLKTFSILKYIHTGTYFIFLTTLIALLLININLFKTSYMLNIVLIFYTVFISRFLLITLISFIAIKYGISYTIVVKYINCIVPCLISILLIAIFLIVTKLYKEFEISLFSENKTLNQIIIFFLLLWFNATIYFSAPLQKNIITIEKTINFFFFSIINIVSVLTVLYLFFKHQRLSVYMEKIGNIETELKIKSGYLDAIISKSPYIYEANITQNLITNGFNHFDDIKRAYNNNYKLCIEEMSQKIIHPDDREIFLKHLNNNEIIKNYMNGEKTLSFKYRKLVDNEYRYVKMILSTTCDIKTKDIRMFAYLQDIHDKTIKNIDLLKKAQTDLLTDIYNKSTTQRLINEALVSHKGALFMIDVDNFKNINDNYGHNIGDMVLCKISDVLKNTFRNNDVIGRVGGDEFMVFIMDTVDPIIIENKAKTLYNSINEINFKKELPSNINLSVGVAIVNSFNCKFEHIYIKADEALYKSKNKGKNQYTLVPYNI